ncbi:PglZ domain-containing protein [Paracoccus sp. (in: a-proteobacteria)]|uniref:PglZ domain-containing protein n=1 Tax=Paracoccus sp. TaxID=267 RepID=UPI00396C3F88
MLVDGKSSIGLVNHQKILATIGGTAILADDFLAMSKLQGRDFIKPHRVIYIYHNQIDQTADTGNEDKTFQAVRTTIEELGNLVSRIINNLNGTTFLSLRIMASFTRKACPPRLTRTRSRTSQREL